MDYKEIQDAEVEAVRAIFMEDYAEVESHTVWKSVNAVHEFTIRVYPMDDEIKTAVNVILHFKLPKSYPKIPPQVQIQDPIGVSPQQVEALGTILKDTAKSLIGSEMVYELATAASSFLTENNGALRFGKYTSLGEDRAKRAVEAEQEATAQAALAEQEAQRLKAQENAKLQAQLEAENAKRAKLRQERIEEEKESDLQLLPQVDGLELAVVEHFDKPLLLPGNLPADVLVKGSEIRQSIIGPLYHAEAVVSSRHGVRLPATLLNIDIYGQYFFSSPGQKKLDQLEEDIQDLLQLRHNNLLVIYGYQRKLVKDMVSQGWRMSLVTEPLLRSTLGELLEDVGELKLPRALPYLKEISAGIEYLHNAQIVHRAIDVHNVHIGRSENGEVSVKLSAASWLRCLLEINRSNRFLASDPPSISEEWRYPHLLINPLSITKAQDIWDFGVLIVQCLFGLDAIRRYQYPALLLAELQGTAIGQLLSDIFSERSTMTATSLVEKVKNLQVDERSLVLSTLSKHGSLHTSESVPSLALQAFSPPNQTNQYLNEQSGLFFQPRSTIVTSRYRSEFEEVEKLGQGGFGQVVKARNKLDNNFYAIKKVKLPSNPALEQKILREVTIWGRLSHPGIVRYHTSWVETDTYSTDVKQALGMLTGSSEGSFIGTDSLEKSLTDSDGKDDDDSDVDGSDVGTISNGDEEDIDLGFDDLDFLSTGHQSRSLSMPTIHFGNDDDPSNEPSRVASRNRTPEQERRSTPPILSPKQSRTLYIQMEFVSGQTLREQIDDGIAEEEMWRILRQLLNAMRYYTSFNIIHRDLKPSNILLDANGNVRIADFGLAVEHTVPEQLANMTASAFNPNSDLTSGVGTSLYLAPETIERRRGNDRGNRYTDKIDIYSLGIIIFEMCWPIQTRMERIDIITKLRRPSIMFPPEWNDTDPKYLRKGKIIRWCLAHEPSKRAGPLDLLRSDLLPPAVQDEYITDTLNLLTQANSPHVQTILNILFQASAEERRAQDLAFDVELEESELNSPYDSVVKQKLERIFSLRGAVDFSPPLLMPASDLYDDKTRKPVRLLNRQGTPVQLPYDLVLPLARFVAREDSITRLKRWNISPVYREDRMGGQPRAFLAASYDLISQHVTLAAEAECIQAIDEVLTEVAVEDDFVHVIGHFDFLAVILEPLSAAKRIIARRVLERYELLSSPWSQVIGEMSKLGLSRKGLDEMAALDICAEYAEVEKRVHSVASGSNPKMKRALQEVKEVVNLGYDLGVNRRIFVSPLLCFKHELHVGGICFQSRLQKAKRRDVFAEGGRYDKLLEILASPGSRQVDRSLVGATFAVSKLSRALAAANTAMTAKSKGPIDIEKVPRRCDVFVVSYTPGFIVARLMIARELWKQGVSTDLMYDDDFARMGPDRIAATARREGIRFLVIVKTSSTARDSILKVKDVANTSEKEVYRQILPAYLLERLGENASQGQEAAASSTVRALPVADDLDAHLLMPSEVMKKMKHKQKQIVLEKAVDSVTDTLAGASNVPLFAVDAEGEAFRLMSESSAWIINDESGHHLRRIIEAFPAARKSYVLELKEDLEKYYNKHHCRWMWLYSLKDTRVNLLSFVT